MVVPWRTKASNSSETARENETCLRKSRCCCLNTFLAALFTERDCRRNGKRGKVRCQTLFNLPTESLGTVVLGCRFAVAIRVIAIRSGLADRTLAI